jgi:hypothetical protein
MSHHVFGDASVARRGRWDLPTRCRASVIAVFSAVALLGSVVPSYALFEKLDHLSGPGPFHGIELQFRAVCVNRQASRKDVATAIKVAADATALGNADRTITAPQVLSNSPAALMFLGLLTKRAEDILANPDAITARDFLELAAWSRVVSDAVRSAPGPMPNRQAVIRAWDVTERKARATLVPRVRHLPGGILWASCYDGPNTGSREVVPPPFTLADPMVVEAVVPSDRHPLFSVNLNYRYYTTGVFFFSGPHTSQDFARGEPIQLQILQVQPTVSIPKTLGILDAQFGIGYYRFTSSDFPAFSGLVLEPRLDAHFPARLLDDDPPQALKLLYSLSFRFGWMNFPDGIDAAKFRARRGRADIPGDEFTFDYGVVVDVGRLFAKPATREK